MGAGIRDMPLGMLGGSGTTGSEHAGYFVNHLLCPTAVPSSEKGQRLVFGVSEHAKNRCPGSHMEEGRRAGQVLIPMGETVVNMYKGL